MPYVDPNVRRALVAGTPPLTTGELTFVLYRAALRYLTINEIPINGPVNFQRLSEVVAALECAKLEFYRRHVAKYEDSKILENGDVL